MRRFLFLLTVLVLSILARSADAGTVYLADFDDQKQLSLNSEYSFDFTIPTQFNGIQPSAYDGFTCNDLYQVYYYVTAQQFQKDETNLDLLGPVAENPRELRQWSAEGQRLYEIDQPLAMSHFREMINNPEGSDNVRSFLRQQLAMLESGGVVEPLYILAAATMWRNEHP